MDKKQWPPVASGTIKADTEDPTQDGPQRNDRPETLPANLGMALRRHVDRLLWHAFCRDKGEEQ